MYETTNIKFKQTKCSETLASILQTPVNHSEEGIQHSYHGESLKQRIKNLQRNIRDFI
jgi:hypothetical protein